MSVDTTSFVPLPAFIDCQNNCIVARSKRDGFADHFYTITLFRYSKLEFVNSAFRGNLSSGSSRNVNKSDRRRKLIKGTRSFSKCTGTMEFYRVTRT